MGILNYSARPVVPGDIVEKRRSFTERIRGVLPDRRIVVDLIREWDGDWHAILRAEDDFQLHDPETVLVDELTVVSHLINVPGWRETEPGKWVKT